MLGIRRRPSHIWVHVILATLVLQAAFIPWYSLVVASWDLSVVGQTPPKLVPGPYLWENLQRVFTESDMAKGLQNSLIISTVVTISVIFTSTLASFAFAKLRFRGNKVLFGLIFATMFIPMQLGIVPLYMIMAKIGWTGHLLAVIVPGLAQAYGIFLVRQYLLDALPDELLDAGRVDGCSTLRLYWHIVLPVCMPIVAFLGINTFLGTWNDLMWPLIALGPENPTAQTALTTLASGRTMDVPLIMMGANVTISVAIAIFLATSKKFTTGVMQGALKG